MNQSKVSVIYDVLSSSRRRSIRVFPKQMGHQFFFGKSHREWLPLPDFCCDVQYWALCLLSMCLTIARPKTGSHWASGGLFPTFRLNRTVLSGVGTCSGVQFRAHKSRKYGATDGPFLFDPAASNNLQLGLPMHPYLIGVLNQVAEHLNQFNPEHRTPYGLSGKYRCRVFSLPLFSRGQGGQRMRSTWPDPSAPSSIGFSWRWQMGFHFNGRLRDNNRQ